MALVSIVVFSLAGPLWSQDIVVQTGLQFDLRSAQGKLIASIAHQPVNTRLSNGVRVSSRYFSLSNDALVSTAL